MMTYKFYFWHGLSLCLKELRVQANGLRRNNLARTPCPLETECLPDNSFQAVNSKRQFSCHWSSLSFNDEKGSPTIICLYIQDCCNIMGRLPYLILPSSLQFRSLPRKCVMVDFSKHFINGLNKRLASRYFIVILVEI